MHARSAGSGGGSDRARKALYIVGTPAKTVAPVVFSIVMAVRASKRGRSARLAPAAMVTLRSVQV